MSQTPNILLISIDSLRRDYCSVYNESEMTMPFLEEFSEDAIQYNNAISPSIWTLPVHTSLFTGLYPKEHGINDKGQTFQNHPTLAEVLSSKGYITKSFGYNGWLRQGATLRGFDHQTTHPNPTNLQKRINNLLGNFYIFKSGDRETVDKSTNFLSNPSEPFFSFIHLQGPHYKYKPKIQDFKKFHDGGLRDMPTSIKAQTIYNERFKRYIDRELSSQNEEIIKNAYRAEIFRTDRNIEKIISSIGRKTNNETIIIIFADHGELFGEDNVYGHNFSLSDAVIRVPLLIYDPTNTFKPQQNKLIQTNDLYPSIANVCGCDVPKTNSIDIITNERNAAFVHYDAADSMYNDLKNSVKERGLDESDVPAKEMYCIWKNDHTKAVWVPEKYENETNDSEELESELSNHFDMLKNVQKGEDMKIDEDVLDNLKDMGYV